MREPTKINDGGPVFPSPHVNTLADDGWAQSGMTLRDWFAGQALAGWLAALPLGARVAPEEIASDMYMLADAMLRARAAAPTVGDEP